jgi:hypothetical protein
MLSVVINTVFIGPNCSRGNSGEDNEVSDISLHKEPELSGGFAELAKKGIKIKDYKEKYPRPKRLFLL